MSKRLVVVFTGLILCASPALATKGVVATEEDLTRLKNDLRDGRIDVNKTRLKMIEENYGEPPTITQTEKKVTYDYGDLKLEFEKVKLWKSWEYDSFKQPVYTDDVDDLRFDLESEELVGKNVTLDKIIKDYGEPTESRGSEEDGALAIYYYGDIKMTFENRILMSSWKAQNLGKITANETAKMESSKSESAKPEPPKNAAPKETKSESTPPPEK